ncbi:MAG TPA: hypothetical protein VMJ35_03835 [Dongiaceae bacterium]|nr:hypothetical protein [Dongiaceae bacterium]
MHRMICAFLALSLVCASLGAQQQPAKPKAAKPIDPLAWLVGGVWIADASMMGGNMVRIETRYVWADNNEFIRFTTHFVAKDRTLNNYDGQFFWDPAANLLRMWYMSARGEVTEGPITIEGDNLRFDFHGTNFEDKPADLRVTLLRKNNDLYTWQLQEKASDGSWKDMAKLEYARAAN